jgi:hypothetical protein
MERYRTGQGGQLNAFIVNNGIVVGGAYLVMLVNFAGM